jgi:hypothetical protein
MKAPIEGPRMPSEELKNVKARIAIVTAAINEAEVTNGGAKVILPLWSELKALRRQAKKLETDKANQATDPGPGSESTEVSSGMLGAPGGGFG